MFLISNDMMFRGTFEQQQNGGERAHLLIYAHWILKLPGLWTIRGWWEGEPLYIFKKHFKKNLSFTLRYFFSALLIGYETKNKYFENYFRNLKKLLWCLYFYSHTFLSTFRNKLHLSLVWGQIALIFTHASIEIWLLAPTLTVHFLC